jgi:site-specific DNA recombinase
MYDSNPLTHDFDALYGRVSSEESAEKGTVANQTEFYRRWKDLHGGASIGEYLDEGVSGVVALEERPGGARLLADVKAGRIKRVLLYRLDRLGRDIRIVLGAVDALEAAGAVVISMTEPFDGSTPIGRFILGMLALFAGFERDSIRQRAHEGQQRKARAGGWLGGSGTAYGYRIEGKRQHATLVIDQTEVPEFGATRADIALWIFEQIGDAGRSCVSVAAELNRIGVPGPRSPQWSSMAMAHMIHNPVYRGVHRYGDEPGAKIPLSETSAPAIVSPDLWERAQAQVTRNMRMSRSTGARDYLLRGVIYCANCGHSYTGATLPGMSAIADETEHRRGVVYRCNGKIGHKCPGDGKSISGEIEERVWKALVAHVQDPDAIADLVGHVEAPRAVSDNNAELSRIQSALARLQGERNAVIVQFRKARIDEKSMEWQLDDIDKEEGVLRSEAVRLTQAREIEAGMLDMRRQAVMAMREIASINKEEVENASRATKRSVIERVIDRITVETFRVSDVRKRGRRTDLTTKITLRYRGSSIDCNRLTWPRGQIKPLQYPVWQMPDIVLEMDDAQS